MSTVTRPPRRAATSRRAHRTPEVILAEQRIVIRNVSWDLYDLLADAIDERQHVHLAYDGKDLEIMTKGRMHEVYRAFFVRLVNALTFELRIRCSDLGETTWKRPEIMRGLESDLCYYFTAKKLAADAKSRARKSNKLADYPNPDMAIEIDISPSEIDRPAISAALKVPELWRFDGESLVIEQLQKDGTYAPVESSRFLPARAEEVYRWVGVEDTNDELAWEQRLREWVRAELAPRRNV
jgi:Uma2 family endonuclease